MDDFYEPPREVVALIELAARLSPGALAAIAETWPQSRLHQLALQDAWDHCWTALHEAGRGVEMLVHWHAAAVVAKDNHTAQRILGNTVVALMARDLIGSHGFRQSDYDNLTHGWRLTVGQIHPNDPGVAL